jgi:hypothetical protein
MDFKRKSLGVAIGAVAAVAMGLTALPASAYSTTSAYYAADGTSAKQHSRADRRAARNDRHKDRRRDDSERDPADYSRDVDRSKTEDGVSRDVIITNDETGKSITHEHSTSRDTEAGTVTHSQEVTGPNGEKSLSTSTTVEKTDDGRTATTTITTPDGDTTTRTVDVSKDPESQSATRTMTTDGADGEERTRETTMQRTDDGFNRTTEFNNGATTNVDASKSSSGEWDREVTRTPGESTTEPESTTDTDSSSAEDSSSED